MFSGNNNKMKYPKISIVTPTYNRAKYLEETILSVLNQGYPNLEYIIIDGGSSDGTVEIIKKYSNLLHYWISEEDSGMYHAIQKGFEKSTGEIMAWINSDDKYHHGAFFIIAEIFQSFKEVKWIRGIPTIFNEKGFCVKASDSRKWSKYRVWLNDYKWIQQESVFWSRELWEKAGSYISNKYKFAGDFELWCRFFKFEKLYCISAPLAGFRVHGNQLSKLFIEEYESEAKHIFRSFVPDKSLKFYIIKSVWKIYLLMRTVIILRVLSILIKITLDKYMGYPKNIYFDINNRNWILAK